MLEEELLAFAKDQLRVNKGWQGRAYVRQCIGMWRGAYGEKVASYVAGSLARELEDND